MSEFSHKEAQRLIHQRRLSAAERLALRNHLDQCATCREHALMDRLLSNYLVLSPVNQRPTSAQAAVYLGRVQRHNRRQRIMKPVYALAGIAAIVVLAVAGWLVMRPNIEAEPLEQTMLPSDTVATPAAVNSELTTGVAASNEELIAAVAARDAAAAASALAAGANPDARDAEDEPVLKSAIVTVKAAGSADIVALLIENGADVNALDKDGNALLPWAVRDGQLEVVQLLLDAGAYVDGTLSNTSAAEQTGLGRAAGDNEIEIAKLLIAHGADVDHVETRYNRAPLHGAAWNNHPEMVELLLDNGADPNLHSTWDKGETPLHFAARNKSFAAAQALLNGGADVDIQMETGQTPLLKIILGSPLGSETEMVSLLLDGGANPDARDNYGNTALHYAAQQQLKSDVLLILLDHAASIDAQNDIGATPLHLAALWNRPEQVTTLIEHGAALDLQNNEGQTAVDVAANDEIKQLLLEAAAAQ